MEFDYQRHDQLMEKRNAVFKWYRHLSKPKLDNDRRKLSQVLKPKKQYFRKWNSHPYKVQRNI